jgi:hypothetical protein
MEKRRRKTDLFLPELTLGATVDSLSLPQQVEISDPDALQQHHPRPAPTQATAFPCVHKIIWMWI